MKNQIFNFNGTELTVLADENSNPYFVAKEVAAVLGYTDTFTMTRRLDEDEKGTQVLRTLGGNQSVVIINEGGLYNSILGSIKPEAKAFKKWITSEVLPSIRKTGAYMTAPTLEKVLYDPDLLMSLAQQLKSINEENARLSTKVIENEPKVAFADAITSSSDTILIREMAKLLHQNGLDTGEQRFYDWLRVNGYLIRKQGTDYNMPTQRSVEMGLFEISEKPIECPGGSIKISKTSKVTPKGQEYFLRKLLRPQKTMPSTNSPQIKTL